MRKKVDPVARANSARACSDCLAFTELTHRWVSQTFPTKVPNTAKPSTTPSPGTTSSPDTTPSRDTPPPPVSSTAEASISSTTIAAITVPIVLFVVVGLAW
ncbi:unnamed protein product, partial [Porites evermanni]